MSTTARDPLQRIRDELVAAAERRSRRRLRRRRMLVIAALPVLLVAASAAAAVGDFTTGVPVIDRLLANEGPGRIDLRPGPGDASEPLPLPDFADGRGARAVAYLSRDGLVCKAQGDFRRRDGAPRGSFGGGCYRPPDLARILGRKKAICCGSVHSPQRRIYDGFAAGDVLALRFTTDDGASFDARLTPPWTPDAPGAKPLRLFVAVDERDIDVGGDGVQRDELKLLSPRYRVEATLRGGRRATVDVP